MGTLAYREEKRRIRNPGGSNGKAADSEPWRVARGGGMILSTRVDRIVGFSLVAWLKHSKNDKNYVSTQQFYPRGCIESFPAPFPPKDQNVQPRAHSHEIHLQRGSLSRSRSKSPTWCITHVRGGRLIVREKINPLRKNHAAPETIKIIKLFARVQVGSPSRAAGPKHYAELPQQKPF